MPPEGIRGIPPGEILRYEEILRLVRIATALGIRKIRLTGGEPLVRRDITRLVSSIAAVEGILDCCLTTNGVLLKDLAGGLKRAGLDRVTVSMDSLRRERFEKITGHDLLHRVLEGIEAALAVGLAPVKINTVVMRGVNDDEIVDFSRLSVDRPIEVRFIERMPFGKRAQTRGCGLWEKEGIAGDEVRRRIESVFGPLEPASPAVPLPGPARLYRIPGSLGRIGLITPMTHPFCHACTRLRLTPAGRLRNCLFSDNEIDVRDRMRAGCGDEEIRDAFETAIRSKPRHTEPTFSANHKWMVEVGG